MFIRPLAAAIGALVSSVCVSTNAAETCGVSFSERPDRDPHQATFQPYTRPIWTATATRMSCSVSVGSDDRIGWYENVGDDGRSFGASPRTLDTAADNPEYPGSRGPRWRRRSGRALGARGAGHPERASSGMRTAATGASLKASLFREIPPWPYDAHAADLDGDGDLDVLAASSDKIAWYENLGNDAFDEHGEYDGQLVLRDGEGASDVHTSDLDGDGDLDVLFASSDSGWQENTGDGEFQERPLPTGPVPCAHRRGLRGSRW